MVTKFIGLTGTFGSGKGVFAEILQKLCGEKNFASYSLSDEVREECGKQGKTLERSNLREVANATRKQEGAGVFAKRVLAKALKEKNKSVVLIDSVRAPAEANELRKALGGNFVLVAIDAPIKTRYERVKERARAKENLLSFGEFRKSEEVEMHAKDEFGQNLAEVMESADFKIENAGTKEELEQKAKKLLEKISAAN
ncbi:MAG: AAA family ATPase [Candidatus Micrarchaeia archaeon]